MRKAEEFWDELLSHIRDGNVIPVVGPELLTTDVDGEDVPFYRVVAERLLTRYGASGVKLPRFHELNDAVCALSPPRGPRAQDLYRPVHEIIEDAAANASESTLRPLRELARISGFRLFVTTTPDDLLARAIDAERYGGAPKTMHVNWAPKLSSGTVVDLPENRTRDDTAVWYLFGKSSNTPMVFTIHDEDTLEFIHDLQINAAEPLKRLFSELRKQNLLLIGCNLPDWLSRFFIRLSNTQRLNDGNRPKREFLIERSDENGEKSLVVFLERFSPNTWTYRGDARKFVDELAQRWALRNPPASSRARAAPADPAPSAAAQPTIADRFFVSYSSHDLAAARLLAKDLDQMGAGIAWFDKQDLKAGVRWEQAIQDAIQTCYLFLALLSANTERRDEGYFFDEWKLACERARRIPFRTFIIPVVLDPDYEGNVADYKYVPSEFKALGFGHAPNGTLSSALREQLTSLLRERRAVKST